MSTVADPETDPRATYAVDPALARRLTQRVVAGPRAATQTTLAPATGAPIAALPLSTPDDVRLAVDSARAAQRAWASRPLEQRARIFLRLHDLVLDEQSDLLDLIQIENGKARAHAFEEVADVAVVARHYARRASAYLRPRRRQGAFPLLSQATELRHPRGVVGIIVPWNYPLTLAVTDAIPALVAGNAVVLKPDTQTALTALRALELFSRAGVPEGLVQVVLGDGPVVGAALVDHVDYVCFTGSTATGKQIAKQCADRLIGCSLELGGKNPILVLRDADVDRAAEGAVRACFSNAGQLCVSTERMFVADQVYDRFVDRFVARVKAMRLQPGLAWGSDMGTLISKAQLDAVTAHVEDARGKGVRVLAGGRARPDLGPYYYEPTVLEGVTPDMRCFGEETFGPVVSVYRFSDEADAIARANDGEYGLNASVWTRDGDRGRAVARRIRCGTVNVNEAFAATFASIDAPMGGMRESGLGRRQGAEGILRYTETQSVATQRLLRFGPMLGLSDERYAKVMAAQLKLLKRLGRA